MLTFIAGCALGAILTGAYARYVVLPRRKPRIVSLIYTETETVTTLVRDPVHDAEKEHPRVGLLMKLNKFVKDDDAGLDDTSFFRAIATRLNLAWVDSCVAAWEQMG